jgi:hypothetical protein
MLAIIIPYYKYAFFEATLQSLADQTDKQFKVYIGDDSSPENPRILLEKYKEKIDFQYKKFEFNLGSQSLVKQWERCIDLSVNEKWFLILGDDDVLGVNCVESFYNNINCIEESFDVVRFSSCNINEEGTLISKVFQNPTIESSIDFFFRDRRSSLSEYLFNKKKFVNVGFKEFPLAWCTDILAVLELSDFGNVYSINDSIVYVRISDKSISGIKELQKLKSKAAFNFLYYLLNQKKQFFNSFQKNELLKEIISIYVNHKKNCMFFFKLSWYFLNNFLIYAYFNFLKSIYLSLIKKKKNFLNKE